MVRFLNLRLLFCYSVLGATVFGFSASAESNSVFKASIRAKSHRLVFEKIPAEVLESSLTPILRVVLPPRADQAWRTGYRFNVALNGQAGAQKFGIWSENPYFWQHLYDGNWEVTIPLTGLAFANGRSFSQAAQWVQSHRRTLHIWLVAPMPPLAVQLEFVPVSPVIPKTTIASANPSDLIIRERSIQFQLSSNVEQVNFECSLGNRKTPFRPCSNPVEYSGLKNGWYRFRARAVNAQGQVGPAVSYRFYALARVPDLEITKMVPDADVLFSDAVQYSFEHRKKNPRDAVFFCQMDGQGFSPCTSPQTYTGLSHGQHSFEVRLRSARNGWTSETLKDDFFVDIEPPVISWISTPETLTAETNAQFSVGSSRKVSLECSLDQAAAVACESEIALTDLAEGAHVFEVKATAENGKVSAPLEFRWQIDRTPPVLQLTQINPNEITTRSNSLVLNFVSNEPSTVVCQLDGQEISNCGSPLVLGPLSEGEHTVAIQARDTVGNLSETLQYQWTIDQTAPILSLVQLAPVSLPSQSTSAEFGFDSESGAQFECSMDDSDFNQCASPVVLNSLSEGLHRFAVRARDAAGNISEQGQLEWVIDRTAPAITLQTLTPSSSPTASTSMQIEFSVSEPSLTMCKWDSAGAEVCQSPAIQNQLADGPHRFTVWATDAAGNRSSARYDWVIETIAYTQLVSVAPTQSPTANTSIQFNFSSQQSQDFKCKLDAGAELSCSSPWTVSGLSDGAHTFEVRALSSLGQPGPSVSYQWVVDATAPVVTLGQITPSAPVTSSTSFSAAFQTSEAASTLCQLDNGAESACASPFTVSGLSSGLHTLRVRATDAVGNIGPVVTYSWTVDTTAPTVAFTSFSPAWTPTASTTLTAHFQASETSTMTCQLDALAPVPCASPYTLTNVSGGAHTLRVQATDLARNVSAPISYNWTVDTTPLVAQNISVSGVTRTSANVQWTSNIPAFGRVEFGVNGNFTSSTAEISSPNTNYLVFIGGLTPNTFYNARAVVRDRDGRISFSTTVTFRTLR